MFAQPAIYCRVCVAVICLLYCVSSVALEKRISLAGRWRFELDPANTGLSEQWFTNTLRDKIRLPGSLPAQGIGDAPSLTTRWMGGIQDPGWYKSQFYSPYTNAANFKFPFWLQPDKYYSGAAWCQRDFEVPGASSPRRVILFLERPHWQTDIWLDGGYIGSNNSLSTPHEYELGTALRAGRHTLTIRLDNSLIVDVGENSHSITDHTQGNWNGIVGKIELRVTDAVWVDQLQIFPNVKEARVRARAVIHNPAGIKLDAMLKFFAGNEQRSEQVRGDARETEIQVEIPIGASADIPVRSSILWDEFAPNLHIVACRLQGFAGESRIDSEASAHFGLRDLSVDGTQFTINGRVTFIRGTLECCIFPKTGHPPADVDSWKRIIRICKAHGLNLIRFHSWCPPEAAFEAADQLGFYYQVEIASWANQSTTLGDGKPVDAWLYKEADRILAAYGNHPSFLFMPYGNEPGGRHAAEYLSKWVAHWKKTDPRHLYTSGSGWPQIPENQFHVTPEPRVQRWGEGLKSRLNSQPPNTTNDYRDYIQARDVPVISHEIGQWCVYPNFAEMKKYSGYLKPKNFEIFRDSLARHHMLPQARDFLLASGKLQTLCYKEDIESALRTPGMAGFELLDLHDFPGQGTALVGVLDPFWDDKGYVTAAEYSRFCNSTVPLARLSRRVFTAKAELEADIEVSHFGPEPLRQARTSWRLVSESGKAVAQGLLSVADIPNGKGTSLGRVSHSLANLRVPARYKLAVKIQDSAGTGAAGPFENDWDVWVYPNHVSAMPTRRKNPQDEVLISSSLDQATVARLDIGGSVLLCLRPEGLKGDHLGKIGLGFSSIFWNTAWTRRQPPHTLGILCNPKHPAFADFPTEFCSNWQWWYVIHNAGAMLLDDFPSDLHPVVQVIDDWVTNRKLALAFEARAGHGRILATSIDFTRQADKNPVTRQLLHSFICYMESRAFAPRVSVSLDQLESLTVKP